MAAVAVTDSLADEKNDTADAHDPHRAYKKRAATAEQVSLQEDIARMRKRLSGSNYLIDPAKKRMQQWDLITMMGLLYTAIVTPVEVGFSSSGELHVVFFVNRCVDLVFTVDLILNFFTMYRDETKGFALIKNHRMIVKRYLYTWFTLDLLSIIPYELLPLPKAFRAVRLIRLMRLLKLARVAKASRVLARYETKLSITYAQRDILKMAVLTVIVSHWMACIMGITDTLLRDDPEDPDTVTWVTQCSKVIDFASIHDRYIVAL